MNRVVGASDASIFLFGGLAYSLATHGVPAADLAKRVPVTTLSWSPQRFSVRTADFVVTQDDDGFISAEGRDKSGKDWDLELPPPTRGLWMAEVNRVRTYFFAGYTGGAGMAPGSWIIALSFDEGGRPVPFYLRGYANYGKDGIQDLLNLDDAGPELVQQEWIETRSVPETRSGYYVTTLYQQRGVYWYRVDGRHGAKTFPMFEQWLMLPNREPQEVSAPQASETWVRDYGNDPRYGVRTTIKEVSETELTTDPPLGCRLDGVELLVLDSDSGREIGPNPDHRGLVDLKGPAVLTGIKRWPEGGLCSAAVAWVGQ